MMQFAQSQTVADVVVVRHGERDDVRRVNRRCAASVRVKIRKWHAAQV